MEQDISWYVQRFSIGPTEDSSDDEHEGPSEQPTVSRKSVAACEIHPLQAKLEEIFPDAQPAFLAAQCEGIPATPDGLNEVVQSILALDDYPKHRRRTYGPAPNFRWTKLMFEQLEIVKGMFPDADPDYVAYTLDSLNGDERNFEEWLSNETRTKNYPKRHGADSRYTFWDYVWSITVDSLLEYLPDPVNFYLNGYWCNQLGAKLDYLKFRYRNLDDDYLSRVLARHGCNVTRTCISLGRPAQIPPGAGVRKLWDCVLPSPDDLDPLFLHEVFAVENWSIITQFNCQSGAETNQHHRREPEIYSKDKNQPIPYSPVEQGDASVVDIIATDEDLRLECPVCYTSEVKFCDMASCEDGHLFCKSCIQRNVEVQFGDGVLQFTCLQGCGKLIKDSVLMAVLDQKLLSKIAQLQAAAGVKAANLPDLVSCPSCDYAAILPLDETVFVCENLLCLKKSCRLCKEPNHTPYACDIEKDEQAEARIEIEERMTKALVRCCYHCNKKYVKGDGCNKIVCPCGAVMCYLCRQPVTDYSHFNGNGGPYVEKCPLYSKDGEIHCEAVRKEANLAKREVTARNPNVKLVHDPTLVLP